MEGEPFALLVPGPRGDMLHDVNAAARAVGLMRGLRAADVAAAHPDLRTAYADPAYERRSLERLAAWARRWSPLTRADGVDGIALDVTGCTHLFGGEAALLAGVEAALGRQALTVRLALAPCHAAAYALARFGGTGPRVVSQETLAQHVADLPVAALGLAGGAVTTLRRLGLKTVGQLERMPRKALGKRFGKHFDKTGEERDPRDETWERLSARLKRGSGVLGRLDAIHARLDLPLDPDRPVPAPRIAGGLAEPIFDADTVLAHAARMIARLMAVLETRGEGVRTLLVEAFRTDGGRSAAHLRLARPTRDARHLARLLAERLEGWRAEYGFDAMAVEALEVAPLAPGQADGFSEEDAVDMAGLVDRLGVRLGARAVMHAVPCESHKPERAERWLPALEAGSGRPGDRERARRAHGTPSWTLPSGQPRPERLLEPPEEIGVLHALPDGPPARFTWRNQVHTVARVAGPERVAPEWWRERAGTRARDYYRAEDGEGRRFWLFCEGFSGDERGEALRWFLHGLFS